MVDKYDAYTAGFLTYATPTQVISAAAQLEVLALLTQFATLFPDQKTTGTSAPHTDFDEIHPETARKIRVEIAALKAAIDAAPTA